MKTMNSKLVGITAILAVSGLTACDYFKVETAKVPVLDPVTGPGYKTFEPEAVVRTANNKWFLWRSDIKPSDVTTALKESRVIDAADDEAFPINARLFTIQSEIDSVMNPIESRINELSDLIRSLNEQLEAELAKPEADRDMAKIDALNTQISAAETEKRAKNTEKRRKKAELKPKYDEKDELEAKRDPVEERGRQAVERITQSVDWFKNQPTSMAFTFTRDAEGKPVADGPITAEIRGWNLNDDLGDRNFSTVDGSIENVTYRARGGVFTFKVLVPMVGGDSLNPRESYCFKMARSKYDLDGIDPRKFYSVDIIRVTGATDTCDFDVLKSRAKRFGQCAEQQRAFNERGVTMDQDCLVVLNAPMPGALPGTLRQGSGKSVDRNN